MDKGPAISRTNDSGQRTGRKSRIVIRTALFSWLISLFTLLIFGLYIAPQQKNISLNVLNSQADLIGKSVNDLCDSAVVTDDYGTVVELCIEIMNSSDFIQYLVLTRKDGYSLIHTAGGWEIIEESDVWTGLGAHEGLRGAVIENPAGEGHVFHYTTDLSYNTYVWGWVHVGLSAEQYFNSVDEIIRQATVVGIVCAIISLVTAVFYARHLVNPIVALERVVRQVTDGNLDVSADIHSRDEVETLAHSFNQMTGQIRSVQQELVSAKEVAEAASDAKSEFLANMSHEIRTPLNGVVGMLQILRRSPLNSQQTRFVNKALHSADALLSVINDILDFSKIEAGKLEIESVEFNPTEIVENVVSMFAEAAEKKDLELICSIHTDVPETITSDPNRLSQILINLVGNAVKFTEHGEVIVTLSCATDSETGLPRSCFEVKDSGIGIAPSEKERIFEAFLQQDSTTTRRFGGTGLGLGICRRLADLMGGRIRLESELERGSTFWFCLPLQEAVVSRKTAPSIRDMHILVVDDHPVSRDVLSELIQNWGAVVSTASSGTKALQVMRQSVSEGDPIYLALIDWKMPDMNGVELGNAISSDPTLEKTIMLMLCSAFELHSEQHMDSGFSAFVPKPARQSELYDAIVNAVNGLSGAPVISQSSSPDLGLHHFGLKILIAEDNEINQEVASEILKVLGCSCDIVGDGKHAYDALLCSEYDLIFMDCMMPLMDGYEATKKIREYEKSTGKHIPIIALTANAMKGDRQVCLDAGMDDYLMKPLEPELVVEKLKQWGGDVSEEAAGKVQATEESADPDELFNRKTCLKRCMDDEEFLEQLVMKFFEQSSVDINRIEEAIANADFDDGHIAAHRLKGAAANLSMNTVRDIAEVLEQHFRQGEIQDSTAVLGELKKEIDRVKSHIGNESEQ